MSEMRRVRTCQVVDLVKAAASVGGWVIRRIRQYRTTRYVELRHVERGKMWIRISDHVSRVFKANGVSVWSLLLVGEEYRVRGKATLGEMVSVITDGQLRTIPDMQGQGVGCA